MSRRDPHQSWRRLDQMWNPHAPDNMMVRHRALKKGEAEGVEVFRAEQAKIRMLARKTKRLWSRGELQQPTDDELRVFFAECRAVGFEGVPKDPKS